MIGTNLFEIIEKSSINDQFLPSSLDALRERMRSHPQEVNEKNAHGYTPCHLAIYHHQLPILEVLVLEGNGDLESTIQGKPTEDLTDNPHLRNVILALKHEQKRKREYQGNHLHDLILQSAKLMPHALSYKVKDRIRSHPEEINQQTYKGRTACHWAALFNLSTCLEMLILYGGNLHQLDEEGNSALQLISSPAIRKKIQTLLQSKRTAEDSFFSFSSPKFLPLLAKSAHSSRQDKLSTLVLPNKRNSANKQIIPSVLVSEEESTMHDRALLPIPQPQTTPVLSPLISLEEAIESDNAIYIKNYLLMGGSPNKTVLEDKRPLLLHALLTGAGNVCWVFIKSGASLFCYDAQGNGLLEHITADNENALFQLLLRLKKKILKTLNQDEINQTRQILISSLTSFHENLSKKGFFTSAEHLYCGELSLDELEEIAGKNVYLQEVAQILMTACSNVDITEKDPINVESVYFQTLTLGLLEKNDPTLIINLLRSLYPYFSLHQKLAALCLVKEIIVLDEFYPCCFQESFMASLKILFQLTAIDHLDAFNKILLDILQCQKILFSPLVNANIQIESILVRGGYYQGEISLQKRLDEALNLPTKANLKDIAKLLAHDLRAKTMQFYRSLALKEFSDKGWEKATKQQLSPHIVYMQNTFDKVSAFLVNEILLKNSQAERIAMIKICLYTLKFLLEDPIPDLHSAMAICSTLNHQSVIRLEKTFSQMSKSFREKRERYENRLSHNHNYREQREIIRKNLTALPFLGIYTRDFTFIAETGSLKNGFIIKGGFLRDLIFRKSSLVNFDANFKTDLFKVLRSYPYADKDTLYIISQRIEPPVLSLNNLGNFTNVKDFISKQAENHFPLQMSRNGEILAGSKGIEALCQWLKERDTEETINTDDAIDILQQAAKLMGSSINPLFYRHKLVSAESLSPQDIPDNNNNSIQQRRLSRSGTTFPKRDP